MERTATSTSLDQNQLYRFLKHPTQSYIYIDSPETTIQQSLRCTARIAVQLVDLYLDKPSLETST
jgi:hypothetical protein